MSWRERGCGCTFSTGGYLRLLRVQLRARGAAGKSGSLLGLVHCRVWHDARTSLIGSIDHEQSLPLYQRMVPNPPTKLNTTFSSISSQLKMLRFTFSTVFNTVGATIRAGADRRATATPTKFIKMLKWPPMAASCELSSAILVPRPLCASRLKIWLVHAVIEGCPGALVVLFGQEFGCRIRSE